MGIEKAPTQQYGEALYAGWMDERVTQRAIQGGSGSDLGEGDDAMTEMFAANDTAADPPAVVDKEMQEIISAADKQETADKKEEAAENEEKAAEAKPISELKKSASEMAENLLTLQKRRSQLIAENTMHKTAVPSDFDTPKEIAVARNTKIMRSVATADTSSSFRDQQHLDKEQGLIEEMLMKRYNGANKARIIAKVAKVFKSFKWDAKKTPEEKAAEEKETKATEAKRAADKVKAEKAEKQLQAAGAAARKAELLANQTRLERIANATRDEKQQKAAEAASLASAKASPEYKNAVLHGKMAIKSVFIPFNNIAKSGSLAGKAQVAAAVEQARTRILELQKKADGERAYAKVNPAGEKMAKAMAAKAVAARANAEKSMVQAAAKEGAASAGADAMQQIQAKLATAAKAAAAGNLTKAKELAPKGLPEEQKKEVEKAQTKAKKKIEEAKANAPAKAPAAKGY